MLSRKLISGSEESVIGKSSNFSLNLPRDIEDIDQLFGGNYSTEEALCAAVADFLVEKGALFVWFGSAEDNPQSGKVVRLSYAHPEHKSYLESDFPEIRWDDALAGNGPTGTTIKKGIAKNGAHTVIASTDDRTFNMWRERASQYGFKATGSFHFQVPDFENPDTIRHFTLNVYAGQQNAFDQSTIETLLSIARRLSKNISRIRQDMEAQLKNTIHEISSQAAAGMPLTDFLQPILERVLDLLKTFGLNDGEKGAIFIPNPASRGKLLMVANKKLIELYRTCSLVTVGNDECFCGRVAATGQPILEVHSKGDSRHKVEAVVDHGHYVLPIIRSGPSDIEFGPEKLLAVLNLYLNAGATVNSWAIHFFDKVGEALAIALEHYYRDIEQLESARLAAARAEALAEAQGHLHKAAGSYQFDVWFDANSGSKTIHGANCLTITGYSPEKFADHPNLWLDMVPDSDRDLVLSKADEVRRGNDVRYIHTLRRSDGKVIYVENTSVPIVDKSGNVIGVTGVIRDISEYLKLQKLATRDPLTGLLTKLGFANKLYEAVAFAKRHGTNLTLIFGDKNFFKTVNDVFGHAVGDKLLSEAGKRMIKDKRVTDSIARDGGDEFALMLSDISMEDARVYLIKKLSQLQRPVIIDDKTFYPTYCFGLSVLQYQDLQNIDLSELDTTKKLLNWVKTMLEPADRLVYKAKAAKKMALDGLRQTYPINDGEAECDYKLRLEAYALKNGFGSFLAIPNGDDAEVWHIPIDGNGSPRKYSLT